MRLAGLSLATAFLALTPVVVAQEPPAPLPLLTKPVDTTALRATLRIPITPPECPFRLIYDGWHELGGRKSEASSQTADIATHLQGGPADAERWDEIRAWYALSGKGQEARDCAERAAEL